MIMDNKELLIRLKEIFRKVFGDDSLVITEEMTANDIHQWNSLSHMILISEIESSLEIKFKLKELNKMHNVGDMINIILAKL